VGMGEDRRVAEHQRRSCGAADSERIGRSVGSGPKVRRLCKKLKELDLSNRTCARRFCRREAAGHRDAAMLRCQYKQLRVLEALEVHGLRVLDILRCCSQWYSHYACMGS